jgi:hypothetical protein
MYLGDTVFTEQLFIHKNPTQEPIPIKYKELNCLYQLYQNIRTALYEIARKVNSGLEAVELRQAGVALIRLRSTDNLPFHAS